MLLIYLFLVTIAIIQFVRVSSSDKCTLIMCNVSNFHTGLSWKVYSGYKKSSRQDVSLFVFEKRSLDKWDRQDRELMLEILRRGVAQLTRIRHPQVRQHGILVFNSTSS